MDNTVSLLDIVFTGMDLELLVFVMKLLLQEFDLIFERVEFLDADVDQFE